MLRILVEAGDREAERLESLLAGRADVSFRRSAGRRETEAAAAAWRPHLLVLDPADGEPLGPIVAEAGAHALSIAFLPPADREQVAELLTYCPIGVLPQGYDRGDVNSLVAAVRSEAELPETANRAAGRPGVEMLALGSAATATLIGFSLPGGPSLFDADRQLEYWLAAVLSLVALVALLGARRPWAAAIQAAVVGLVTLAPTQA